MDLADETPGGGGEPDAGLLGRLPRQRPQNASRRRESARAAAESNGTAPSATEKSRAAKAARKGAAAAPAKRKAAGTGRRSGAARPSGAKAAATKAAGAKKPAKAAPKAAKAGVRSERSKPAKGTAGKTRSARKAPPSRPRRAPADDRPPVPPQGYESDGDRAKGIVSPPGGADLAATALEALGELTRFSLSAGEKLMRDLLGRRS